jgi:hypothetical protein
MPPSSTASWPPGAQAPAPLQLPRHRYRRGPRPDQGGRRRARRGQPGQPGLERSLPAPARRSRHRHPGRAAGWPAAAVRATAGAARARPAGPPGPDRAPRQRPGRRGKAVPRRPRRPARSGRHRVRRADLARRQADQAGARGRTPARRRAAPRPVHPHGTIVQQPGARARGPAGQAYRPDRGAGRLAPAPGQDASPAPGQATALPTGPARSSGR